jgi:hypothetical protein
MDKYRLLHRRLANKNIELWRGDSLTGNVYASYFNDIHANGRNQRIVSDRANFGSEGEIVPALPVVHEGVVAQERITAKVLGKTILLPIWKDMSPAVIDALALLGKQESDEHTS